MDREGNFSASDSAADAIADAPVTAFKASLVPVFLDLRGKKVLLVGGGIVARRKLAALADSGANIVLVAPEIEAEILAMAAHGRIVCWQRKFIEQDLFDAWMVIAATDDAAENQRVYALANARRIFANVVDDAEHCSFHSPARIQRGALQIAISSGGVAPMLARHVREQLERQFDDAYSDLSELLQRKRNQIRQALPEVQARRGFFERALGGELMHLLRAHQWHAACLWIDAQLEQQQTARATNSGRQGRVALVGAGPGDPGLLTLRALRVLNLADVILTDQLVSPGVLALARRDAEVISVGKKGGGACTEQAAIHALLLKHAQAGKFVVRLKGGDAFVFGRGGEELEFLRAHEVPFEVVPGITAALACAAYSGIPLTHRELAQSVRFLTAHCKSSIDSLDWQALADDKQTLAVYMGVSRIQVLQERLAQLGRCPQTPVALIENGTRADQRVVLSTLGALTRDAKTHRVQAPCLMIIGAVASLASQLHWFGKAVLEVAE